MDTGISRKNGEEMFLSEAVGEAQKMCVVASAGVMDILLFPSTCGNLDFTISAFSCKSGLPHSSWFFILGSELGFIHSWMKHWLFHLIRFVSYCLIFPNLGTKHIRVWQNKYGSSFIFVTFRAAGSNVLAVEHVWFSLRASWFFSKMSTWLWSFGW